MSGSTNEARAAMISLLLNPNSGPHAMAAIRACAKSDIPIPGILKPWMITAASAWEEANKARVNKMNKADRLREAIHRVEYLRGMGHKRDYALWRAAEEMNMRRSSLERSYKDKSTKAARDELRQGFQEMYLEAIARGDLGFKSVDELKAFLRKST